jgi:hypothetical protein
VQKLRQILAWKRRCAAIQRHFVGPAEKLAPQQVGVHRRWLVGASDGLYNRVRNQNSLLSGAALRACECGHTNGKAGEKTVKLLDSRSDAVLNATTQLSGITPGHSALAAAAPPPLSCRSGARYFLMQSPGQTLPGSASFQQTSLRAIQDRIRTCLPLGDWEV